MTAPRARRARRSQAGVSLVELLIAISIMGVMLLALAGLIMASMASSATHRATVRAGTEATEVAERIDDLSYIPCPYAQEVASLYGSAFDVSPGRLFDETLVSIQYLKDRSRSTADATAWQPSCPATDQGAQRITIRVTNRTSPTLSSELTLVKRDDRCPAGVTDVLVDGATPTTVVRASC
jgi:prepilin-type N-terminal cleavage/methylation domain-containing protein